MDIDDASITRTYVRTQQTFRKLRCSDARTGDTAIDVDDRIDGVVGDATYARRAVDRSLASSLLNTMNEPRRGFLVEAMSDLACLIFYLARQRVLWTSFLIA